MGKWVCVLMIGLIVFGSTCLPALAQTPTGTVPQVVAGNAIDLIPAGQPGAISVIQVGPYGKIGVPAVVWNNTGVAVRGLTVVGTIRDPTGALLAIQTQGTTPDLLEPGQMGFVRLPFWTDLSGPPPAEDTLVFETYIPSPAPDVDFGFHTEPLQITSYQTTADHVLGKGINTTDAAVDSIVTNALCFDSGGQAIEYFGANDRPAQPMQPGAEFLYSLKIEQPCDFVLVAVQAVFIGTPPELR